MDKPWEAPVPRGCVPAAAPGTAGDHRHTKGGFCSSAKAAPGLVPASKALSPCACLNQALHQPSPAPGNSAAPTAAAPLQLKENQG